MHHTLSARNNAKQVPLYIQDKEVQSHLVNDRRASFASRGAPDTNRNLSEEEKKAFYVCYPNYSLPDLSFLENVQAESNAPTPKVILSPTKPPRSSTTGAINKGRPRPRSLNDFENLSRQSFKHIRDWDSLNVLLPNEFKKIMEQIQARDQSVHGQFSAEKHSEYGDVKMRYPRSRRGRETLASQKSVDDKLRAGYNYPDTTMNYGKRYSLQEEPFGTANPFQMRMQQHDLPSVQTSRRFMKRSETMPCCTPHVCQWQPPAPCAHHCYHHHHTCYRTPCASSGTSSRTDPTIDQLCELLSMDNTLQEVTTLLNRASSPLKSPSQSRDTIAAFHDKNFRVLKKQWEALADSLCTPAPTTTVKGGTSETKSVGVACRQKPQIPAKPASALSRTNKSGSSSKPAKRPVSLHAPTFKSMIPVPKGTKTPPGTKLNSPVTNFNVNVNSKQTN